MSTQSDLQDISTKISSINNYSKDISDIFTPVVEGVTNPDLATVKAELQGWTTTQLNNCAKLNVANEFTQNQKIRRSGPSIQMIDTRYTYGTPLNYVPTDEINFYDSNGSYCAGIQHGYGYDSNLNDNYHFIRFGLRNLANTATNWAGLHIIDSVPFFNVPGIPLSLERTDAVINLGYLNNIGNSVVHKSGNEEIAGSKKFTASSTNNAKAYVSVKNLNPNTAFNSLTNDLHQCVVDFLNVDNETIAQVGANLSNNHHSAFLYSSVKNSDDTTTSASIQVSTMPNTEAIIILNAKASIDGLLGPKITNIYSLGLPNYLWSEVYAGNGTIQTSDENVKTEISTIPETVLRAWGKVNFQQFKFKDAVSKKGSNARIHMGVIAQRIQEAFKSEGLDARKYGLFCWNEWEDQYEYEQVLVKPEVKGQVKVVDAQAMYNTIYKDDGTEEQVLISPEKSHMEEQVIEEAVYRTEKKLVQPAGSRYSVRYEECLALECAYQRWILKKIAEKVDVAI